MKRASEWGQEFMHPGEWCYEDFDGWLSREAFPREQGAIAKAALELDLPAELISVTPVLMREESEVEAKIHGNEAPCWVECTSRAKKPEPFWRVTVLDAPVKGDSP